jgi:hypothetical protein
MAFVAEDGTGKVDANAYVTVEYCDAYFLDRGNAIWAAAQTTAKQQAIVRATDYIETRWFGKFKGSPAFPDTPQALSFPRIYTGPDAGVAYGRVPGFWYADYLPSNDPAITPQAMPVVLSKATAEYAMRALSITLAPDLQVDPTGRGVQMQKEKVGPIETETHYDQVGPGLRAQDFPPYPMADRLLDTLVNKGGRSFR